MHGRSPCARNCSKIGISSARCSSAEISHFIDAKRVLSGGKDENREKFWIKNLYSLSFQRPLEKMDHLIENSTTERFINKLFHFALEFLTDFHPGKLFCLWLTSTQNPSWVRRRKHSTTTMTSKVAPYQTVTLSRMLSNPAPGLWIKECPQFFHSVINKTKTLDKRANSSNKNKFAVRTATNSDKKIVQQTKWKSIAKIACKTAQQKQIKREMKCSWRKSSFAPPLP